MVHVLVVDDDAPLREALSYVLEDEGYSVEAASDGKQALDLLRTSPHRLVVLLDLYMPGLDGMQVLQAVAEDATLAQRHVFILATATPQRTLPLALVHLLTQLDVPLLPKPLDIIELLQAITAAEVSLVRMDRP